MCSGFTRRTVRFNRVGVDALHSRITALFGHRVAANQSRFANDGQTFARSVGQLTVGATALFVFTARNTFRVFRSTVFATVAGAAVGIIHARIRSAARTVRETALRTRIVARSVVRAGDAFAGV